MDKVFFTKGDYVRYKHKFSNVPEEMLVVRVNKTQRPVFDDNDKEKIIDVIYSFKGVVCQWFNKNGTLCEGTFNTKDIIKIYIK